MCRKVFLILLTSLSLTVQPEIIRTYTHAYLCAYLRAYLRAHLRACLCTYTLIT